MIHFDKILCIVEDELPISYFCMSSSIFSSTISHRDYRFPSECFWLLCRTIAEHICRDLVLGYPFCSNGWIFILRMYHSVLIILLCINSIFWKQKVWWIQVCVVFLGLLGLFGLFCGSVQMLRWFFIFNIIEVLIVIVLNL